jgi:hypothetical protein
VKKKILVNSIDHAKKAGEWILRGPPRPTIHRRGVERQLRHVQVTLRHPAPVKKKLTSSIQAPRVGLGEVGFACLGLNEEPTWPRAGAGSAWLWRGVEWRGVTDLSAKSARMRTRDMTTGEAGEVD